MQWNEVGSKEETSQVFQIKCFTIRIREQNAVAYFKKTVSDFDETHRKEEQLTGTGFGGNIGEGEEKEEN